MAVVIRPKFSTADINKMVAERIVRIEEVIFLNLQKIGEEFITHARNNQTYKDRTGNLRSSTGYVILHNGEQVFGSTFDQVNGPEAATATEKGSEKGKEFIEEIKAKFPRGFVLIGVAGMDYAAAVEAKGYDVITASSIEAATSLREAMERIAKKAIT